MTSAAALAASSAAFNSGVCSADDMAREACASGAGPVNSGRIPLQFARRKVTGSWCETSTAPATVSEPKRINMPLSLRLGKAMRPECELQFVSPETGLAAFAPTQPMRECMERQSQMFQKNLASRIAIAVSVACATNAACAQDELEETVVTATRTPRPLDSVGAPVIVISRNDIERSM